MSSVDDRIVNMQFNSKQFTQGASDSMKSLDQLEKKVAQTGNSKGLANMGKNVDTVRTRFGAMQVAGVAAIATIASKATMAGLNIVKSLTISPIMDGFREYQTNLNSIQTIMANTGATVKVVNGYLDELNHYSDQTIYNFSQMASAIGKFTASGVKLPQATDAIKGMANTAALSGASANDLNRAMYQMSQGLASGTIKLMDWNSLVQANMGGQNVQKAIMATADSMGAVGDAMTAAVAKHGTFRDSLTEGWLSADVFTKTMKVMAGTTDELTGKTVAFSTAQLKAMGYTDEQAKKLNKLSQASIDAATQIKSFPQLMQVVQESIGSMWSKTFTIVMGNFTQSKALWTRVGTAVTDTIGSIGARFNGILQEWVDLGGRTMVIHGFTHAFKTLGAVFGALKGAWQAVFPPAAGEQIITISRGFNQWMKRIQNHVASGGTLDSLQKIFGGIFAVLHIGYSIVTAIGGAFMSFFREIFVGSSKGAGGFLKLLAQVGEFLMQADKMITSGDKIGKVLDNIGAMAGKAAGEGMQIVAGLIGGIVEGLGGSWSQIQGAVVDLAMQIPEWFKDVLGIHSPATELIPVGLNIVMGIVEGIITAQAYIAKAIIGLAGFIGDLFVQMFSGMDAMDLAAVMNTLFTGALILSVRQFVKTLDSITSIRESVTGILDQLTGTLKGMQNELNARAIMNIAIAVALLAASIVALSFVDPKEIAISLGAIALMIGMLVKSIQVLSAVKSDTSLLAISAAMVLMSAALVNLALAITILGQQDPLAVAQGIGAVAIALTIMVGALFAMSKIKGSIEGMAASIFIIAAAMNLLATAILALGSMSLETLGKGLGAIGIGLGIMVAAMRAMDKMKGSPEGLAASILVMALAMNVLAAAVLVFGTMSLEELAKGLGAIAIGLALFIGAFYLMSSMTTQIAILAPAIMTMSLAMLALAAAVSLLGGLSLEELGKGLGAIAVGFAILLAAAALAPYVAPGLILLSVTLLALGQGLALAGAGMLAFGVGFAIMAAAGTAGVAVLAAGFQAFMALLPQFAIQLAASFVAFVKAIAAATPKLRKAFGQILENIIGTIEDAIPVIGRLFSKLLTEGLRIIGTFIGDYVEMGFTIIDRFLKSAEDHVPHIANSALGLLRKFMDTISKNIGPLADSAAKMIIAFINGIADAIDNNVDDLRAAGLNMAHAILNGLTGGLLDEGMSMVRDAAETLADALPGWMRKVLGIESPSKVTEEIGKFTAQGLAVGLDKSTDGVLKSAGDLAKAATKLMKDTFYTEGAKAVDAAASIANAIIAGNDDMKKQLQQSAYSDQSQANAAAGVLSVRGEASTRASNAAQKAQEAAEKKQRIADRVERKAPKKKTAKDKAEIKKANRAARQAQAAADRKQKIADQKQKLTDRAQRAYDQAQLRADASAQAVADRQTFLDADNQGKGDLKQQEAVDKAGQAQALLAKANAEFTQAAALEKSKKKSDRELAKKLRAQGEADAKAARTLADAAINAERAARQYYGAAIRESTTSLTQMLADADAAIRQADADWQAQKIFDKADTAGKAEIMQKRAEESQAKANAARTLAMNAVNEANRLADTDAAAAALQVKEAEKQAQIAIDAANQAAEERRQAADLLEQAEQERKDAQEAAAANPNLHPSRTALEDAAKGIDRYNASLQQASALAAGTPGVVQYNQYNTSPKALSPSEVYRNTKNLLSSAEIKMGVTSSPDN